MISCWPTRLLARNGCSGVFNLRAPDPCASQGSLESCGITGRQAATGERRPTVKEKKIIGVTWQGAP